jgi:hypothetical protein
MAGSSTRLSVKTFSAAMRSAGIVFAANSSLRNASLAGEIIAKRSGGRSAGERTTRSLDRTAEPASNSAIFHMSVPHPSQSFS